MPRYVMASRRAGKFRDEEKQAARAAIDITVAAIAPAIDVVGDSDPVDNEARRTIVFDAEPGELDLFVAAAQPDVIVEPEILHRFDAIAPMDFVLANQSTLDGPVGNGPGFDVAVRGDGKKLRGADVILFLRGGGLERQLVATTGASGNVSFDFDPFFTASALLVIPAGDFWPTIVRGPDDGVVVNCLALPKNGPLDWWHDTVGVDRFLKTRGKGIRVGVADTGLGPHPALDHVSDVGAFINGSFDAGGGADSGSHGSHVTGTIGARPAAADDYVGIAPGVDLFSARVFPPNAGANQGDIANGIDALSKDHACDLINLSLGARVGSQIIRDAIIDAVERGTLCVCAAANSGGPVEFPAAFPETAAVSAIGKLGTAPEGTLSSIRLPANPAEFGIDNLYLANFSCRGPEITCAGPGVGIISTVPERFGLKAPYGVMDGTSMASPAACAALAAALAKDDEYRKLPRNEMRAAAARRVLVDVCRDIGLSTTLSGAGVPQAERVC